jgi:hypothetical protein
LQRAQLLAALSVGSEIIQLRDSVGHLGIRHGGGKLFGADLDPALAALAQANSTLATARLARLDEALAAHAADGTGRKTALRARGNILALSEALTEHATYFDAGAPS